MIPNSTSSILASATGLEWNQGYRSASQGDNWFLSSIVAINADTGDYVWHYQATPGEEWDFDAVQQLILADLTIDGMRRQVVMQANKNGFFYVIDRKTGQLISAKNFTPVTWASGVDQKTGRPIENPGIRYDKTGKPAQLLPGALGAHSWQAMAFNPKTGLVYIPAQEIPMTYESVRDFKPAPMGWNIATATTNMPNVKGYLIAWDPVNQREVWRANYLGPWNGGILTTAGNLVVQGNAAGDLTAYRADTGEKLWSMFAQSPVMAAPVTYEINGEQYIAVLSGWGGAYPLLQGIQSDKSGNERNISRVLVFKLGGKSNLPPLAAEAKLVIDPPPATADAATVASGEALYDRFCSVCHGEAAVGGGVVPDLRGSPFIAVDAWYSIVLDGALKEGGMAAFGSVLDRTQATAIRDYIIHRANEDDPARSARGRRQPDPSHGAVIAAQGTAAGAPACAQCHAFSGGSDSSGAFPRIAGQSAFYLARQLRDFSSGVRANAIMSPIASALSPDDIDDVAAYYANVEAPFPPLASLDPDSRQERRGTRSRQAMQRKEFPAVASAMVWAALASHQQSHTLRGQYAHYTAFELQMWQRGFRRNSPEAMATVRQEARRSGDRGGRRLLPAGSRLRSGGDAAKGLIQCRPTRHTTPPRTRPSTSQRRSERMRRRKRSETGRSARSSSPASPSACSSSAGWPSISSCSCREARLAEPSSNPLQPAATGRHRPGGGRCPHREALAHGHGGDARRDDGGHRGDRHRQRAAPGQQCRGHRSADASSRRRVCREQSRHRHRARRFRHRADHRRTI